MALLLLGPTLARAANGSPDTAMEGCDCGRNDRPRTPADTPSTAVGLTAPEFALVSTERVGPLSDVPSLHASGIKGTDLGVSFVRDGNIIFLFGDSWTHDKANWDDDSVATTKDTPHPTELAWRTQPNGRFERLHAPGVSLGAMEVPVEGVARDNDTFVFFSSGWGGDTDRHDLSVLAKTSGTNFTGLTTVHSVLSQRFINLNIVEHGDEYFIYGNGTYRKSAIYLAKVKKTLLEDRTAWRYLQDGGSAAGPSWVSDEMQSSQVIPTNCAGEMSVRYEPAVQRYLMTYNCHDPFGVALHTSKNPDGPWSQPIAIFDRGRDGYGKFMHAVGSSDTLSEPGREDEWGGQYGPYLVPSWTEKLGNGDTAIYYTLSSWNPYQVHLLRTVLRKI